MQIEILGTEYSIERKKISDDILLETRMDIVTAQPKVLSHVC